MDLPLLCVSHQQQHGYLLVNHIVMAMPKHQQRHSSFYTNSIHGLVLVGGFILFPHIITEL